MYKKIKWQNLSHDAHQSRTWGELTHVAYSNDVVLVLKNYFVCRLQITQFSCFHWLRDVASFSYIFVLHVFDFVLKVSDERVRVRMTTQTEGMCFIWAKVRSTNLRKARNYQNSSLYQPYRELRHFRLSAVTVPCIPRVLKQAASVHGHVLWRRR
jgi:hypothetical protein